ncbi:putative GPI transamidase component Gpi16, partial [Hortaea werneckii]
PLPKGYLYAGFNFTATTSLDAYQKQHFRYFPRSLGQILQHSHADELHLRFAVGRWDDEEWGARPRDGRREGGTGVEIWAWVDGSEEGNPHSDVVVEERWSSLVNSLSGLFCASLNFIDGTKTTRPVLSFEPEGSLEQNGGRRQLLHGTLPHEVVCTENLTPFLKLLPCKGKAGISSLLDGHKVFDANWQTIQLTWSWMWNAACAPAMIPSQGQDRSRISTAILIENTTATILAIQSRVRVRPAGV